MAGGADSLAVIREAERKREADVSFVKRGFSKLDSKGEATGGWSFSQIKAMRDDPELWYSTRVLGRPRPESTAAATLGSRTHEAFERIARGIQNPNSQYVDGSGEVNPLTWFERSIAGLTPTVREKTYGYTPAKLSDDIAQSKRAIEAFQQHGFGALGLSNDRVQIFGVEHEIQPDFSSDGFEGVLGVGKVDLWAAIDGKNTVVDWKPKVKGSPEEVKRSDAYQQANLYAYTMRQQAIAEARARLSQNGQETPTEEAVIAEAKKDSRYIQKVGLVSYKTGKQGKGRNPLEMQ